MAVIKEYTTEAKLETFLGIAIASGEADDAINGAVDIIDVWTDRNFIADTNASLRRYSGNDRENLLIDECVEITAVAMGQDLYGDSTLALSASVSGGYYPIPRDFATRLKPIKELHLRGRVWTKGIENHSVTAKWGYSTSVPQAIATAATILAAGLYNFYRSGGGALIKSEKIGNYAVTYESPKDWTALEQAKSFMDQYKRMSL